MNFAIENMLLSRALKSQFRDDYKTINRRRIYIRQGEINAVIGLNWLLLLFVFFSVKLYF